MLYLPLPLRPFKSVDEVTNYTEALHTIALADPLVATKVANSFSLTGVNTPDLKLLACNSDTKITE